MVGISWQGLKGKSPFPEYAGPSWSWAGFDGFASSNISLDPDWTDIASIKSWHRELKNESNPYGEVKNAWIQIHGPVTPLTLSTKETTEHEVRMRRADREPLPRFCTRYSKDDVGMQISPDYTEYRQQIRDWDLLVLILRGNTDENRKTSAQKEGLASPFNLFFGLVIRRSVDADKTEKLERVGWVHLNPEDGQDQIIEDERNWITLTLV